MWRPLAAVILLIALLATVLALYMHVKGSTQARCLANITLIRRYLSISLNAFNLSAPFNGCSGGCTWRLYVGYQALLNASRLANSTACVGYRVRVLISNALTYVSNYNPANVAQGLDEALNLINEAYRELGS